MDEGDFTLSIILSALGVECALTQVFLKWKGIESGTSIHTATDEQRELWEKDYLENTNWGKFKKSADFVSMFLTDMAFEAFVTYFYNKDEDHVGFLIKAGFPSNLCLTKLDHFQKEIYSKRNRIMHWGKVDYERSDAEDSLKAAIAMINILKQIDRRRYEHMERNQRQSLA